MEGPSMQSQQSLTSMHFEAGGGLHSFKHKRRGSTGTSHMNVASSAYTNESYTECTDEFNFFNKTSKLLITQNCSKLAKTPSLSPSTL